MNYIDLEFAIKVHDMIINKSGGMEGIRDVGQLESVLFHIKNDLYYPTFTDKLTHLIFSVIKFHMFNDGNKRTSISLGLYFMNLNHYTYADDDFIQKMESIVIEVANNNISKEQLLFTLNDILNK
ncbi:type II toxin-antitoxin system death-on-curing family toxin [Ignavigranum ruoffiae]|uniref:Death on curing protein n=1 Tax=Ignavigranum ruoffiae TaxID=89093 RepID=A0A1H9AVU5_9LACT|nr:type II toxin-antitoxin system death-on-curing family toxin [Ignavigranum ruoffiae]SEP80058.1 death on curing protein [Ignavigranum ruoffiae]